MQETHIWIMLGLFWMGVNMWGKFVMDCHKM